MGPVCTSDTDCDDGIYCNGTEHCSPGAAETAANGCVAGSPPCSSGETCDETSSSCISVECPSDPSMRDMDGDGHQTMACPGGDDCDDTDPNRFPGNDEVCDAAGHDEDCNTNTVGDTDADGDTYVSATCCNGDTCGPDCDDSNPAVHPGIEESCNGIDDDCNGIVDDSGSMGMCSMPTPCADLPTFGLTEQHTPATYQDATGTPWPGVRTSSHFWSLNNHQYNALSFLADSSSGTLTFEAGRPPEGPPAVYTIKISRCPGDFTRDTSNPDVAFCQRSGASVSLRWSPTTEAGSCTLIPGVTYYLNIVHGTIDSSATTLTSTCSGSFCSVAMQRAD